MMAHTAQQLTDLRAPHSVCYLVKFQIGATWYYLTDADVAISYGGNNYLPGYIAEIDDIEITSEPRTNDINITLSTYENSFVSLILGGGWMNESCVIYKHFYTSLGAILTKVAFEGLLSAYDYTPENNEISLSVESIWADWEKMAGIKTNPTSYNRFYNATGMRHAPNAMKKVYWGKDAPSSTSYGDRPPGAPSKPDPQPEPY